ncbi:MAG: BMP family ABC transporter substrate-binding protein [Chloroflexi bacterium]|nr:BMP family ABC transporter substrate-binding protein [Chloroflexota bacterium]
MRSFNRLLALGASVAIIFAACGGGASAAPTIGPTEAASIEATPAPTEAPAAFKACLVTDTGGLGDKGFNDNALKGLQDALAAGYATEVKNLESKKDADYTSNIDLFVADGCQQITTVGFNMGEVTATKAGENGDIAFSIVDFAYDPAIPNVTGIVFATEQAGMLAGYLAAGVSATGKIGTYGGLPIPPVTVFMDGLAAGIAYYNQEKGTSVELLGWNAAAQSGVMAPADNPWGNSDFGNQQAQAFFQEGADIVVPVAGGTGIGSFNAAKQAQSEGKKVYAIGVDTDQYLTAPGFESVILTSIQKIIDKAVADAINLASQGNIGGTNYVGTLANGGVGISPFHDLSSLVSADLSAGVDALKAKIVDGSVKVADYLK